LELELVEITFRLLVAWWGRIHCGWEQTGRYLKAIEYAPAALAFSPRNTTLWSQPEEMYWVNGFILRYSYSCKRRVS